eukprot:m51a1_g9811 hypothetical protein (3258) ;mRNA; f:1837959-1852861
MSTHPPTLWGAAPAAAAPNAPADSAAQQFFFVATRTSDRVGSETTSAISVRLGTASALSRQTLALGRGAGGGGAAGPFGRGSHDGFHVRCSDLCGAEIATVVVSSDCSGASPAWALEELTVRSAADAGAPTLVFACGRVLDGLSPSVTLSSPSRAVSSSAAAQEEELVDGQRSYSIEVATSKEPGAETTAMVFVTLEGELSAARAGPATPVPLRAPRGGFRRGSAEKVAFLHPDVGDLRSVTLEHDASGSLSPWQIDSIVVSSESPPFRRWRVSCPGTRLQRAPSGHCRVTLSLLPTLWRTYRVQLDGVGETTAGLSVVVRGEGGASTAPIAMQGRRVAEATCADVGDACAVVVSSDGAGAAPDWFLSCVDVSEAHALRSWHFACNKYLSTRSVRGGRASLELRLAGPAALGAAQYRVAVLAGGTEESAPTRCSVRLRGSAGTSALVPLAPSAAAWGPMLRPGCEATFAVAVREVVGDLWSVVLEQQFDVGEPQWLVERVAVTDVSTGRTAQFAGPGDIRDGGRTVELSLADAQQRVLRAAASVPEPPGAPQKSRPRSPPAPPPAGGDEVELIHVAPRQPEQRAGSPDVALARVLALLAELRLEVVAARGAAVTVGDLRAELGLVLRRQADILDRLDSLEAAPEPPAPEEPATAPPPAPQDSADACVGEGEGEQLDGAEEDAGPDGQATYEIVTKTGDLWKAGTAAEVYVVLHGSGGAAGGQTEQLRLSKAPAEGSIGPQALPFGPGARDVFRVTATDVGDVESIDVRLSGPAGAGGSDGWFLEWAEVSRLPSERPPTRFPCHRWLDSSEADGQTSASLPGYPHSEPAARALVVVTGGAPSGAAARSGGPAAPELTPSVWATLSVATGGVAHSVGPVRLGSGVGGHFGPGAVDRFALQAEPFDRVDAVLVELDCAAGGAGWLLEYVAVVGPDGAATSFPCHRRLSPSQRCAVLRPDRSAEAEKLYGAGGDRARSAGEAAGPQGQAAQPAVAVPCDGEQPQVPQDLWTLLWRVRVPFEVLVPVALCEAVVGQVQELWGRRLLHGDIAARSVLLRRTASGVAVQLCPELAHPMAAGRSDAPLDGAAAAMALAVRWTAPEVFAERRLTLRSTLFALGMFLLELFSCGRCPYAGLLANEAKRRLAAREAPDCSALRAGVHSERLHALICRCVAGGNPAAPGTVAGEQRPPNAGALDDVARELRALCAGVEYEEALLSCCLARSRVPTAPEYPAVEYERLQTRCPACHKALLGSWWNCPLCNEAVCQQCAMDSIKEHLTTSTVQAIGVSRCPRHNEPFKTLPEVQEAQLSELVCYVCGCRASMFDLVCPSVLECRCALCLRCSYVLLTWACHCSCTAAKESHIRLQWLSDPDRWDEPVLSHVLEPWAHAFLLKKDSAYVCPSTRTSMRACCSACAQWITDINGAGATGAGQAPARSYYLSQSNAWVCFLCGVSSGSEVSAYLTASDPKYGHYQLCFSCAYSGASAAPAAASPAEACAEALAGLSMRALALCVPCRGPGNGDCGLLEGVDGVGVLSKSSGLEELARLEVALHDRSKRPCMLRFEAANPKAKRECLFLSEIVMETLDILEEESDRSGSAEGAAELPRETAQKSTSRTRVEDFVLLIWAVGLLFQEIAELRHQTMRTYSGNVWNLADWLTNLFIFFFVATRTSDKDGSETTSAISVRLGTASALSQQTLALGRGAGGGGAAGPFGRGSHDGFHVRCSDLCGAEIATVVVSSDCSGASPAWALEELTVRSAADAGAPTLVFACGRVLDGLSPWVTLSSPTRIEGRTAPSAEGQDRGMRPFSIEVATSKGSGSEAQARISMFVTLTGDLSATRSAPAVPVALGVAPTQRGSPAKCSFQHPYVGDLHSVTLEHDTNGRPSPWQLHGVVVTSELPPFRRWRVSCPGTRFQRTPSGRCAVTLSLRPTVWRTYSVQLQGAWKTSAELSVVVRGEGGASTARIAMRGLREAEATCADVGEPCAVVVSSGGAGAALGPVGAVAVTDKCTGRTAAFVRHGAASDGGRTVELTAATDAAAPAAATPGRGPQQLARLPRGCERVDAAGQRAARKNSKGRDGEQKADALAGVLEQLKELRLEAAAARQEQRSESAAGVAGIKSELKLVLRRQSSMQERLLSIESALASASTSLRGPQQPEGTAAAEEQEEEEGTAQNAYGAGTATYVVATQTGELCDAGTTEEVYVVLHGAGGVSTERLRLTLGEAAQELPFGRGARDVFRVTAADVGDVESIEVGFCGPADQSSDGWLLEWVEVARQPSQRLPTRFPCHRWLDSNEADGQTAVTLRGFPRQELCAYALVFVTGTANGADGAGDGVASAQSGLFTSGVSATLSVSTGGVVHSVGPVRLGSGIGGHFGPGAIDTFALEAEPFDRVDAVLVEHDSAGDYPHWLLEYVAVVGPQGKTLFPCHRRLSRGRYSQCSAVLRPDRSVDATELDGLGSGQPASPVHGADGAETDSVPPDLWTLLWRVRVPVEVLVPVALAVVRDVRELLRRRQLHGDIAARSVLLRRTARGVAVQLRKDLAHRMAAGCSHAALDDAAALAVRWTAPEVFAERRLTLRSAVFAVGMFLLELFSGGRCPPADRNADSNSALCAGEASERLLALVHACRERRADLDYISSELLGVYADVRGTLGTERTKGAVIVEYEEALLSCCKAGAMPTAPEYPAVEYQRLRTRCCECGKELLGSSWNCPLCRETVCQQCATDGIKEHLTTSAVLALGVSTCPRHNEPFKTLPEVRPGRGTLSELVCCVCGSRVSMFDLACPAVLECHCALCLRCSYVLITWPCRCSCTAVKGNQLSLWWLSDPDKWDEPVQSHILEPWTHAFLHKTCDIFACSYYLTLGNTWVCFLCGVSSGIEVSSYLTVKDPEYGHYQLCFSCALSSTTGTAGLQAKRKADRRSVSIVGPGPMDGLRLRANLLCSLTGDPDSSETYKEFVRAFGVVSRDSSPESLLKLEVALHCRNKWTRHEAAKVAASGGPEGLCRFLMCSRVPLHSALQVLRLAPAMPDSTERSLLSDVVEETLDSLNDSWAVSKASSSIGCPQKEAWALGLEGFINQDFRPAGKTCETLAQKPVPFPKPKSLAELCFQSPSPAIVHPVIEKTMQHKWRGGEKLAFCQSALSLPPLVLYYVHAAFFMGFLAVVLCCALKRHSDRARPEDYVLLIWTAALLLQECKEIKPQFTGYFRSPWNWADLMMGCLFLACQLIKVSAKLSEQDSRMQLTYDTLFAIASFCAFLRILYWGMIFEYGSVF